MDFEKRGALPQDFVENRLAQVRYGGKPDVVNQIVRQVIADSFGEEHGHDCEGDHGPDVMDAGGDDLRKVDLVAEERIGEENYWRFRGGRVQDAIENRADEQYDE